MLDTELDLAASLRGFLEAQAFDVANPRRPAEVLRGVESGELGLCVLGGDHARAGRDSLVTAIRQARFGDRIPILLLVEAGRQPDAVHDQADLVLHKPLQLGQVARVVRALRADGTFSRPQSAEALRPALEGDPISIRRKGSLEQTPFSELFGASWRATWTGTMALKSGSTWRRVEFVNGFPVKARSNLVTEHLLRYLLRLGFISPETYRQLLPRVQTDQWDSGSTLERAELISDIRLEEAKRRLTSEIILQCFRWTQASYRLEKADEPVVAERFDLNPFRIYQSWLVEPSESVRLEGGLKALAGRDLKAAEGLTEHAHLLVDVLAAIPLTAEQLADGVPVGRLSELAKRAPEAAAAIVTLVDLGAAVPVAPAARPQRAVTGQSSADAVPKLKRIRQILREDEARLVRARSPRAILGLAEGASRAEVRDAYQRLGRFYRPENFERLGDSKLLETARELLAAFRAAAAEILGEAPPGPPLPTTTSEQVVATPTGDDRILAEVFFDDGHTYLRVGDLDEAKAHFARSHVLDPESPKYLTYHAWCTYQLSRDDPDEAMKAKQALLAALKVDSRNDRALYFLGCVYEETGRVERAVECWKKALRINSGNFEARAALRRLEG